MPFQIARHSLGALFVIFCAAGGVAGVEPDVTTPPKLSPRLETIVLDEPAPRATIQLLSCASSLAKRPVILMLGELKPEEPPFWSVDLLREGYVLAAFQVDHPLDPDPKRRPQWLVFDQRFAHSYVAGGARAPHDAGRVIDYLSGRSDVAADKIGWLGSSSSGIPGLAVATREPRLAAIVAFVSTGAYEQWLESWHTNGLWRGESKDLWPETRALFTEDPIRHVETMFPCAVLMVSGGDDKVVDPATARAFVKEARPYYENDPERLRLVVYEGFGHNLPRDVVKLYAEHWFHLYLHPTRSAPAPPTKTGSLDESVRKTQINSADHKDLIRAKKK